MFLSIITINFNNLAGLKRTYDSVVSQTWTNYEWIVIDGGSTDGSREFIEQHQDKFAYWCSEPDKGIYNAMNKGIARASGEYLNFMNSGDAYHDDNVLLSVFSQDIPSDADVLYGNYFDVYEDGYIIPQELPNVLDFAFLMRRPINHQSTFIKRKLFSDELYDESYKIVADGKAFMKWMIQGKKYYHLDTFVADFYMGGVHNQIANTIAHERKRIIDETIPESIRVVAEQLETERGIWIDYPYVKDALEIYKSSSLKRKFITLLIKLLN
jgi:glycosyltransferase involved in cell wall biosynthesis